MTKFIFQKDPFRLTMKKLNRILLIDDDEINNFVNLNLLEGLKIAENIEIVTNGKLGLEFLVNECKTSGSRCPGLVILDHHMPIMDGLELMQALKALGFLEKNSVIFLLLGINSKQVDVDVFLELGVHEVTPKPLSEETIMNVYQKYWSHNIA